MPKGGPAGGDGGKGGSIIFVGDEGLTTLLDLRYQKQIVAEDGENGKAKNCFGKDAQDIYIKVPVGSIVRDLEKGIVIADITKHNQEVVIAKGGRGGRGNWNFRSPRVVAPTYAENGEAGQEREIRIELKVFIIPISSTNPSAISEGTPDLTKLYLNTLLYIQYFKYSQMIINGRKIMNNSDFIINFIILTAVIIFYSPFLSF
jgi:hypothetical protein